MEYFRTIIVVGNTRDHGLAMYDDGLFSFSQLSQQSPLPPNVLRSSWVASYFTLMKKEGNIHKYDDENLRKLSENIL